MRQYTQIKALERQISELEATIAHYQARDEMLTELFNHITEIAGELEETI